MSVHQAPDAGRNAFTNYVGVAKVSDWPSAFFCHVAYSYRFGLLSWDFDAAHGDLHSNVVPEVREGSEGKASCIIFHLSIAFRSDPPLILSTSALITLPMKEQSAYVDSNLKSHKLCMLVPQTCHDTCSMRFSIRPLKNGVPLMVRANAANLL